MKPRTKPRSAKRRSRASTGSARRYEEPHRRAKRLADLIIAESVDGFYTQADNALFMLHVTSLVCAAFTELRRHNPVFLELVDQRFRATQG